MHFNPLKVFQIRFLIVPILFFSLMGSSIHIPNSSAQEDIQIPDWIKNVAGWWANGDISENEFLKGIEYLINNDIIFLHFVPCNPLGVLDAAGFEIEAKHNIDSVLVPGWVKNNAKWWHEDLIEDIDFINGIQHLVKYGIIKIDNKKILGKVPLEDIVFSPAWITDKSTLVFINSSFFELYGRDGNCLVEDNGKIRWVNAVLGLDPNKMGMYNEVAVWDDPQKAVVVYPYFTYAAYNEPGFYTYFRGECDDCTTTKFALPNTLYTSSGNGHQALTLLGYPSITDVEIDQNPSILQQFDKVIMLHNEYVTRTMFDAITSHPNVVYLYPNALYAEIEVDYDNETITLIRGHHYPEREIDNGFDWEYDNTHPYEFDSECAKIRINQIKNGWQTNCYPENVFLENSQKLFDLLKIIKDL